MRRGRIFNDILGLGIPEINGIFTQVGALWAYKRPDEPSVLQQYPALPKSVKPRVRVTNEALLGYAFDESTSPNFLSIIHVRAGRLARSGDPRRWRPGELTPLRALARTWAANDPNATEWYYPRRLRLDIDAASSLRQTAAARYLGLRLLHGGEIDLPLYAFSTALTKGRVARGARRLVQRSDIEEFTVIDDRGTSHLDPLSAAPSRNHFLKSVVPFLRRATAR
jgi:hypothetical protein